MPWSRKSHLSLISGDGHNPLREGTCRRVGCAEVVVDLGLCAFHLKGYNDGVGRREREIAAAASANFDALLEAANRDLDHAGDDHVERDWLRALGEHLAAHGVDPETAHDEKLLRQAVLDALGDYADVEAGRGHLKVVA